MLDGTMTLLMVLLLGLFASYVAAVSNDRR